MKISAVLIVMWASVNGAPITSVQIDMPSIKGCNEEVKRLATNTPTGPVWIFCVEKK